MTYIDGFVVPVPNEKKQAYRDLAARAATICLRPVAGSSST